MKTAENFAETKNINLGKSSKKFNQKSSYINKNKEKCMHQYLINIFIRQM